MQFPHQLALGYRSAAYLSAWKVPHPNPRPTWEFKCLLSNLSDDRREQITDRLLQARGASITGLAGTQQRNVDYWAYQYFEVRCSNQAFRTVTRKAFADFQKRTTAARRPSPSAFYPTAPGVNDLDNSVPKPALDPEQIGNLLNTYYRFYRGVQERTDILGGRNGTPPGTYANGKTFSASNTREVEELRNWLANERDFGLRFESLRYTEHLAVMTLSVNSLGVPG